MADLPRTEVRVLRRAARRSVSGAARYAPVAVSLPGDPYKVLTVLFDTGAGLLAAPSGAIK
jgi:hypothetical protein